MKCMFVGPSHCDKGNNQCCDECDERDDCRIACDKGDCETCNLCDKQEVEEDV